MLQRRASGGMFCLLGLALMSASPEGRPPFAILNLLVKVWHFVAVSCGPFPVEANSTTAH